jgi:hypothetical protein
MPRPMRRPAALRVALIATTALAATALTTAPAAAAGSSAGSPMPDLRDGSLMHAYRTVDFGTPVRAHDVSGLHRHVIWPPSWKVCTQSPAPGDTSGARTVTVGVVKKLERCPG